MLRHRVVYLGFAAEVGNSFVDAADVIAVVAIDTKTGQLNLLPGQIIVSQSTGEGQLEFVSVGPACPEVKP